MLVVSRWGSASFVTANTAQCVKKCAYLYLTAPGIHSQFVA